MIAPIDLGELARNRRIFEEEARSHLRHGDLLAFENPVIPIKTRGRWYGSLSRQVAPRVEKLPDLVLTQAVFQEPYLFVAIWDDRNAYTERDIAMSASACLGVASAQRMALLAMPVLGGKEGFRYLAAAEFGIQWRMEHLEDAGLFVPDEHVFVTDKNVCEG